MLNLDRCSLYIHIQIIDSERMNNEALRMALCGGAVSCGGKPPTNSAQRVLRSPNMPENR